PDQEVKLRADRIVKAIGTENAVGTEALRAALRGLAARSPRSTAEVLLAYLPDAADEQLQAEVLAALTSLTTRDEASAKVLAAAVQDPHPLRRRALATCLARSPREADRAAVRKLLDDADGGVRLHASERLLRIADAAGVPALFGLIEQGPE